MRTGRGAPLPMDDLSKLGAFALLGDADPVPQSLFLTHPEQAKTLMLLYEVSRELTSILDREELLRRVAERVKKIVNYHVFSVMLWNEQAQLLESAFAMRYEDSIPVRLRLPLLIQDRLIGVLDLESTEPHAFTPEHERMLSTLGSYIAIALENARLYEEARENERRLRSDLDTAREIQRQLLPTGAREVPGLDLAAGYVPARELGGDFYDFLPYGQGRLGFALGDVSGKGAAAALYGSLAIGTVREIVVDHARDPAYMLALLNRRLNGARLDARFIALLFAIYDAPTRKLTLANAGAPYPLLVRDGHVQEIRLEGVPLGLFPEAKYDEMTIDLRPGDVVLFASDGILESENAEQEEFGSERLTSLLSGISPGDSAQRITEQILAATDGHSGVGIAPHDDRTLIVLRLTEEASSDFSKLPIIY